MYDKAVRRRRAVSVVLVALSLTLLTAYFGESSSGGLHSVQRGAMEVLAPIQEGANRGSSRCVTCSGGSGRPSTPRSERDKLKKERDSLRHPGHPAPGRRRREQAAALAAGHQHGRRHDGLPAGDLPRLRALPEHLVLDRRDQQGLERRRPPDQPVINGEGLVGKITSVSDGNAIVMLLTDQEFGVSAKAARSGEPGSLDPAVGAPGDLLLELSRAASSSSAASASSRPAPSRRG